MSRSQHNFDRLQKWSELSDTQLMNQYSAENVGVVKEIALQLSDRLSEYDYESAEKYVSAIRQLHRALVEGSRDLARAIVSATDLANDGKIPDARNVYEQFIRKCDSPFYRAIAQSHLKDTA